MATYQVAASTDDFEVYWDGSQWVGSFGWGHVEAGYNTSAQRKLGCGLRFLNVTIPDGATIISAKLTITARWNASNDTVNSVIIGEKNNNAAPFSNLADYQARRGTVVGGPNDDNITAASVNWNAISHWTAESGYDSPDISSIIQELVDTYGGLSGANIALFWDDHAGNSTESNNVRRMGYPYDVTPAKAVVLAIEYTKGLFHKILEARYITETPEVNRAYVIGEDSEGNPVYGTDIEQDEIDLVGERLDFTMQFSVPTGDLAADVADAWLKKHRLAGNRGYIVIPPNAGVELWDVIQVTDKPCAQDGAKYRVAGIRFDYEPRAGKYHHRLSLGGV